MSVDVMGEEWLLSAEQVRSLLEWIPAQPAQPAQPASAGALQSLPQNLKRHQP